MSWEEFLDRVADVYGLSSNEKTAFLKRLADANADANNAKVASNLSISVVTLERHLKSIYTKFSQNCPNLNSGTRGQFNTLRSWLKQKYAQQYAGEMPSLAVIPTFEINTSNPFGDTGCITDSSRFFNREELIRQIFEELGKGVSISLIGESQIGKSSILYRIYSQGRERMQATVEPKPEFIYLSLQWVAHEDDFYKALCDRLKIPFCRDYDLTRVLVGRRYVLCLDEIEKMAWDGFTKQVRSHLRGLADGADAPLTLVLASRSPLAHLFPDSSELDSPLAGLCVQLYVKPFTEAVVRDFLVERSQGTGVRFSEQEMAELFVQSEGHPARLQRAAAELYRSKQDRR